MTTQLGNKNEILGSPGRTIKTRRAQTTIISKVQNKITVYYIELMHQLQKVVTDISFGINVCFHMRCKNEVK